MPYEKPKRVVAAYKLYDPSLIFTSHIYWVLDEHGEYVKMPYATMKAFYEYTCKVLASLLSYSHKDLTLEDIVKDIHYDKRGFWYYKSYTEKVFVYDK